MKLCANKLHEMQLDNTMAVQQRGKTVYLCRECLRLRRQRYNSSEHGEAVRERYYEKDLQNKRRRHALKLHNP